MIPSSAVSKTNASGEYFRDSNKVLYLVISIYAPAIKPDDNIVDTEGFYRKLDENARNIEGLARNREVLTEMLLTRVVDNFLTYLADLLRLVMRSRPETMLTERGTIDQRRVLQASSIEELKKELIEERVMALSYKSVTDLASYLKSRLRFDVFPNPVDLSILVKTIEARNIYVHNRGRMNARYIERAGGAKEEIGTKLTMQPSDVLRMNGFLDSQVNKIDKEAISKFSLPISSE